MESKTPYTPVPVSEEGPPQEPSEMTALQEKEPIPPDTKPANEPKAVVVTTKHKEPIPERENWGGSFDFLLAMIGYCVGFGNIWRFPYLCYKNGGGAFLIPYFICLAIVGIPMALMETALGQFMSQGGILCWKICPAFQGIGYATTMILWWCNNYYIVLFAYALYYFYSSLTTELPWQYCGHDWNTDNCVDVHRRNMTCEAMNVTGSLTEEDVLNGTCYNITNGVSPAEEFWKHNTLRLSSGIEDLGGICWHLVISVIVSWIIVYFCIFKGVKSSGKVVYFTATFPYVVLFILLIRGVTLEGAGEGLKYYLTPDFSRLSDSQVWIDGGTQIFYSYAIGFGALSALGSYNRFHHNCYRDTMILAAFNSGTSLIGGVAIFSVLGYMAHQQGVDVSEVTDKGPGLVFIAYPTAVSLMPAAPVWSCIFFLMLIFVGLDSQFVQVEAFVTAISDMFPRYIRKGHNREKFSLLVCLLTTIPAFLMVTEGGSYIFEIYNYYSASGFVLLTMTFFESIAIGYVYGGNRFYENMVEMIGFRPNPWFKYAWLITVPGVSVAIWLFGVVTFEPLKYNDYTYPWYGDAIGWMLGLSSVLCIPGNLIAKMLMTPGSIRERWQKITTPQLEHLDKQHDVQLSTIYQPGV